MLLNFLFTKYRKHSPNIPIPCTKLPRPSAHIINGRGNLEWIHIYKHQCYFYATGIPVPSLRFGTPLTLKGSFLILQRRFTPWNGLGDLAGSPLVVDQNINPTSKTKATFMVCPSDEEMKRPIPKYENFCCMIYGDKSLDISVATCYIMVSVNFQLYYS